MIVKAERPSLLESIEALPKFPWKIPKLVEKGFEIPICVTETYTLEVGKFVRLGMDVVVNAAWLALEWAKKEGNEEAVSALKALILDWPMDFVLIAAKSPEELEEKKFVWNVNLGAKIERLREYIGLDSLNLMRVIAHARDITSAQQSGGRRASFKIAHAWLAANIKWGIRKCPNEVDHQLRCWERLEKAPKALELVEVALQRWGRDNLLDYPTKIRIITEKRTVRTYNNIPLKRCTPTC